MTSTSVTIVTPSMVCVKGPSACSSVTTAMADEGERAMATTAQSIATTTFTLPRRVRSLVSAGAGAGGARGCERGARQLGACVGRVCRGRAPRVLRRAGRCGEGGEQRDHEEEDDGEGAAAHGEREPAHQLLVRAQLLDHELAARRERDAPERRLVQGVELLQRGFRKDADVDGGHASLRSTRTRCDVLSL